MVGDFYVKQSMWKQTLTKQGDILSFKRLGPTPLITVVFTSPIVIETFILLLKDFASRDTRLISPRGKLASFSTIQQCYSNAALL